MSDMKAGIAAAQYLIGLGVPPLPKNGAVAIVSVLWCESGLNPGSQGAQSTETPGVLNPHGAYGVASWNGQRQQELKAFCDKHGLPYESVESQLRFFLNECAIAYPRTWAAIRSTESVNSIIAVIVDDYERPKNAPAEIAKAESYAAELAPLVTATAPPVVTTPIPSPAPTTSPVMDPVLEAFLTKIIGIVIQSVMSAVLQHLTSVIQTGAVQSVPAAPAVPSQPGAINWSQVLQELGQTIEKAVQPPTK